MEANTNEAINLIFPSGADNKGVRFSDQDFNELELDSIIHMLDSNRKHAKELRIYSSN